MPLLPETQDAWRSFGQRHRRVRSAVLTWAGTHSVLSCTRKGSSPEMAGSVELQLPLPMALRIPPNGTPIRRWQHIIAKRSCTFACPGTGSCSWADSKCKKKRKLGPTDCRSGSVHVTTTPPGHADKDCLTTEENVTISSSRITRQGRCRSGAAESSLAARNNQPTKTRRPQRTMVTRD